MNLAQLINKHKIPTLVFIGASFLILFVTLILVLRPQNPQTQSNEVTVVTFNDGSNEVTVDRNGTVTIKTPFGTFTQYWDKEKIRSFFADLENLDFDTLVSYVGTEMAISLTVSNGQTIIIDSSLLPEEILDALQYVLEETYEIEKITVIKTTPPPFWTTPTPRPENAKPTVPPDNDNPWHQGVEPENIEAFSCEAYSVAGGKRVIVSQTLCGQ